MNERDFNLLIIQAVKRDADFLIKRHKDLNIIEWKNFRRAPLQVEDWDDPLKKINSFCGIFSSVNWLLGHSQPLFKRAVIRCFEKNKVFEGSKNFPNFSQIFREIDKAAVDLELDGYEHKNVRDHLKFVSYSFIEAKDILDIKHGFTIQNFISKEDIILNVMDEDSDFIISTIITDIFRDLQRFYEKNPTHPPRLRTLIIVDECRRIFTGNNSYDKHDHNPHKSMVSFVTTRRASGIGLIAITQEPESSPSWLTDNSAYLLAFPIGGKAREHVRQLTNLNVKQSKYIDELPKLGTGIFRDRRFNRRYLFQVPGDLITEQITVEKVDELMKNKIEMLHSSLPKSDIEYETTDESKFVDISKWKKQTEDQVNGLLILKTLRHDPFIHFTALRDKLDLSPKKMRLARDWLYHNKIVTTIDCVGPKGKKAEYLALTEESQHSLKIPISDRTAPSHFRHTLYCERVKKWLETKGHKAMREFGLLPDGKLTPDGERIDVFAVENGQGVAYEITLTINKKDLMSNVNKCLYLFTVDKLFIVCEVKKPDIEKAKRIVSENVQERQLEKIIFKTIKHFV